MKKLVLLAAAVSVNAFAADFSSDSMPMIVAYAKDHNGRTAVYPSRIVGKTVQVHSTKIKEGMHRVDDGPDPAFYICRSGEPALNVKNLRGARQNVNFTGTITEGQNFEGGDYWTLRDCAKTTVGATSTFNNVAGAGGSATQAQLANDAKALTGASPSASEKPPILPAGNFENVKYPDLSLTMKQGRAVFDYMTANRAMTIEGPIRNASIVSQGCVVNMYPDGKNIVVKSNQSADCDFAPDGTYKRTK